MKDLATVQPKDYKDKNFGLSLDEFNQMVIELRNGNYELYERVFLQHFQSCVDYVKFRCKTDHSAAYDASMDAMLDVCRRIKLGRLKYGNLRFLFTRIACQYCLQTQKKNLQIDGLDGLNIEDPSTNAPDEILDLLEESLAQIASPCRDLLVKFYFHKQSLKEIATLANKTEVALRKQKQRCLAGLRSLFLKKHNA